MNILNKFENIKIDKFSELEESDKKFCKSIQARYEKTLNVYKQLYEIYQKGKDEEALVKERESFYSLSSYLYLRAFDICEKVISLNESFIFNIYNHFADKYKVKLERKKVSERKNYDDNVLETKSLNYKTYVDDILEQLDGLNFQELRITQLKQSAKNSCMKGYNKEEWNIKIKSDTIIFFDLLRWSYDARWNDDYELNYVTDFKIIECALGWFELGRESKFWQFNIFDKYNLKWNEFSDITEINSKKN